MALLPMFPLGTVLFPGLVLPLHLFEPRYRALIRDVLAGDGEFGVVLIERGSEVGGDDVRSLVGTVAHVEEAVELEDGRWAVIGVGTRRIRVSSWAPDDPYPRAEVDDLDDPTPDPAELDHLGPCTTKLRRALAMAAEIGEARAPATLELDPDPVHASYQMAAVAPIGSMDQQALLAAPTVGLRLARLDDLLAEAIDVLGFRLASGGDGSDELGDPDDLDDGA